MDDVLETDPVDLLVADESATITEGAQAPPDWCSSTPPRWPRLPARWPTRCSSGATTSGKAEVPSDLLADDLSAALDGADLVWMRLPKGLGGLDEYAELHRQPCRPRGEVAGGRVKHMTLSQNEVLLAHFGSVNASLGRQKSRVLQSRVCPTPASPPGRAARPTPTSTSSCGPMATPSPPPSSTRAPRCSSTRSVRSAVSVGGDRSQAAGQTGALQILDLGLRQRRPGDPAGPPLPHVQRDGDRRELGGRRGHPTDGQAPTRPASRSSGVTAWPRSPMSRSTSSSMNPPSPHRHVEGHRPCARDVRRGGPRPAQGRRVLVRLQLAPALQPA